MSMERVQTKNSTLCFIFFLTSFCWFLSQNLSFYHVQFLFDEVSNFRNSILTDAFSSKQEKKFKMFLLIRLNAQYYEETNSKYFIWRKL